MTPEYITIWRKTGEECPTYRSKAMTPIEIMVKSQRDESDADDPIENWEVQLAEAALTALTEAGWSVVPSEATEGMIEAAKKAGYIFQIENSENDAIQWTFEAMIEAGAYKV